MHAGVLKYLHYKLDTVLLDTAPMLQMPDALVGPYGKIRVIIVIRTGNNQRGGEEGVQRGWGEGPRDDFERLESEIGAERVFGYYGYHDKVLQHCYAPIVRNGQGYGHR
jgi:hypothetical protein